MVTILKSNGVVELNSNMIKGLGIKVSGISLTDEQANKIIIGISGVHAINAQVNDF